MIRFMQEEDRTECKKMLQEFYTTGAVSHDIPEQTIQNIIDSAANNSPYVKVIACKDEEKYAGVCTLCFTFSSEMGGLVVQIEDLYIRDGFKGKGFGTAIFQFIRNEYDDTAKRYRLEVVQTNTQAIRLYKRLGFEQLEYQQMVLEL